MKWDQKKKGNYGEERIEEIYFHENVTRVFFEVKNEPRFEWLI